MTEDIPEIMTIAETCRYLRVPRSSLYKLAQEGKIPCQKVGRHWRFFKPAIQEWISQKGLPTQHMIDEETEKHQGTR